jgi:hypothetical protein
MNIPHQDLDSATHDAMRGFAAARAARPTREVVPADAIGMPDMAGGLVSSAPQPTTACERSMWESNAGRFDIYVVPRKQPTSSWIGKPSPR